MVIINSDTNAFVCGVPIPVGQLEVPFHGNVTVLGSGGLVTNVYVGSGDTLVVWGSGCSVMPGVDVWSMFLLGVWLVVCVFGLMAVARRLARFLSFGKVKEV